MNRRDSTLLVLIVIALAGALWSFARYWKNTDNSETRAFFYDLSEKELFVAPASSIPPIKGLNDHLEDAVRAVVVSTNGNPKDRKSWHIVYLEKYSPELKQEFEAARRQGNAPQVSRVGAQAGRFVKRVTDQEWVPMTSDAAGRILNEWLTAGPGGTPATICSP